jgi:hypothetical protein
VPGSDPLLAHEALHIAIALAIPIAAACIARRVRREAGVFAAGAAALIGGFGWISSGGADFVASPSEARYGADMVAASPNSVYELFPPALPREMGLVLLGLAGTLMLLALGRDRPTRWYAAGIVAGCAALVSFPMLFPAVLWATVCAFVSTEGRRFGNWLRAVGPAVLLFALWLAPVAFWYATEGGFVDIVPVLGVEWPLGSALAAWGLLFPLALGGATVLLRDRSPRARSLIGFSIASATLLLLAVARREFGWELQGNQTLFHQGRMWPVAHLVGSALAGVALAWIVRRFRRGSALVAAIFAVGCLSLVLSAAGLFTLINGHRKGFVYADEDLDAGSFVRAAAARLSPGDVVLVEGNNELAFKLFEFSGVSLGNYDDPRLEGNEARIRYGDLAEAYMQHVEEGGFAPTHVVVQEGSVIDGEILEGGEYQGRNWELLRVHR